MPKKFSFEGLVAPKPTDRLFFAVFPPAEVAARIRTLAEALRTQRNLNGRPLKNDRFHVTINHVDDYAGIPPDILEKAIAAGDGVKAAQFDVVFDRAATLSGRRANRPFVLRGGQALAGLKSFQLTLGAAMKKAGLGRLVDRMFTPHVTLLYDGRLVTPVDVEPVAWTVNEFVLVHSLLGQTKHIPVKTWALSK